MSFIFGLIDFKDFNIYFLTNIFLNFSFKNKKKFLYFEENIFEFMLL